MENIMITKCEFRKLPIAITEKALMCGGDMLVWLDEKERLQEGVKLLCEKYQPKSVLEIGFGMGYTAQAFQDCGVKKHTIIEAHPEIYQKAMLWAEDYPDTDIIFKFFQDYKTKAKYDVVYDDRMDLVFENDEFVGASEKTRNWLKSYCNAGGVVAGYARELAELKEFDVGFYFNCQGGEYRQPIMAGVEV